MIVCDRRDVPQTITNKHQLDRMEHALIGILGMDYDPSTFLKRDPDESDALALLQIECIDLLVSMEMDKLQRAKELLMPYQNEEQQIEKSDRDVLLIEAIDKWTDRKYQETHAIFTDLLKRHPRDILTLFATHMLEFHMGWTEQMLHTVQEALTSWDERDDLYGFVKGIEAFCLEENGFYEEAVQAAQVALQFNKRDIYAIHAICHCFYETGQYAQGAAWMEERMSDWRDNHYMRIHVWWHYAIFKLYDLDFETIQDVYRTEIRRKNEKTGLEDLDAVSLLWRVKLAGADQIFDWKELFECWAHYPKNSFYWFNDMHALFVFVATGEVELAERILEQSLNENCNEHVREIVKYPFEGIHLFSQGKYQEACSAFEPYLESASAFGGSNAQRDIIEMTAIEAAIRANEFSKARSLMQKGRCLKFDSPLQQHFLSRMTTPISTN